MIDFGPLKYVLSVVVTAEETSSTLSLDSSSVSDKRSLHGGNPRRGRLRRARSHPLRRWWRGRRCVRAGRARPWGGRDGPRRRTTFRDRRLLGRAGLGGSAAARHAEVDSVTAGGELSVQTPRPADDAGPQPSVAAHRAPIGSASMTPAGTGGRAAGRRTADRRSRRWLCCRRLSSGGCGCRSDCVIARSAREPVRQPQPRASRIARLPFAMRAVRRAGVPNQFRTLEEKNMHRLLRRTLSQGRPRSRGGAVGRAERFRRWRRDRSNRSGPRGGGRRHDHPGRIRCGQQRE